MGIGVEFITFALDQLGVKVTALWAWVILIGGVVLVFSGVAAFFGAIIRRVKKHGAPQPQVPSGDDYSTKGAISPSINNSSINNSFNTVASTPTMEIPWVRRAGGPIFSMRPEVDEDTRIQCSFRITADKTPGGLEVKWIAPGVEMAEMKPMAPNSRGWYSIKPMPMDPNKNGEVLLKVMFWLEDGQHGGIWRWPLRLNEKGRWQIFRNEGSGVNNPKEEDCW